MAYISTSEVKRIREALKVAFPEFKFGVRKVHGGLSVGVTIVSGPLDLSPDFTHGDGYAQINQYHLDKYEYGAFYQAIDMIIRRAPVREYYNRSEPMIDYFDVAFYYDIHIGNWNKPYEVKFPRKGKGIYHIPDFNAEAQSALAVIELAA